MNISVFIGYVVDTITMGYVESSWDETIEEVLQENTVLWDRLAEV